MIKSWYITIKVKVETNGLSQDAQADLLNESDYNVTLQPEAQMRVVDTEMVDLSQSPPVGC